MSDQKFPQLNRLSKTTLDTYLGILQLQTKFVAFARGTLATATITKCQQSEGFEFWGIMGANLSYPNEDLSGKVALVTGGNTGIGYETAKALARMGAHTFIGCRSQERAEQVFCLSEQR